MRILVTGSSGHLGEALVRGLVEQSAAAYAGERGIALRDCASER